MPDLFSMGTSNNAPPPIPGGFGNPTGANRGIVKANSTASNPFPFLPTTGAHPSSGTVTPSANNGLFSATNLQALSGGLPGTGGAFGGNGGNLTRELQDTYGKGTGQLLSQIFSKGLFNPQVAAAFLNALQPGIARGESDILQAFGAEGARFGSAAALGLGDYESQVNLNEQQTLATLYQQDQQAELSLLSGSLGDLRQSQANRASSGVLGDILGGLEIAGGAALEFVPGGQIAGAGLIGSGVSTIGGANGQGGGGSNNAGSSVTQALQALIKSRQKVPAAPDASGLPTDTRTPPILTPDVLGPISAGNALGGNDPFSTDGSSNEDSTNSYLQYLLLSNPDMLSQLFSGGGLG